MEDLVRTQVGWMETSQAWNLSPELGWGGGEDALPGIN